MIERSTLTIGGVAKAVSAVVFVVGWTIAVYSWVSGIDTTVQLLKRENDIQHAHMVDSLRAIESRTGASEKTINDLSRAIDRASVLLERIDQKMGKP